jgi:hypothetical protein
MTLTPSLPRCGIFRGPKGLRAALIDTEGRRLPVPAPQGDDSDRYDWLARLHAEVGLHVELVLTDSLARTDPLGRLALTRKMLLWLAPDQLLMAISTVALASARPADAAAILARLPACPAWRPHLRRVRSLDDPRQLLLL